MAVRRPAGARRADSDESATRHRRRVPAAVTRRWMQFTRGMGFVMANGERQSDRFRKLSGGLRRATAVVFLLGFGAVACHRDPAGGGQKTGVAGSRSDAAPAAAV